MVISIGDWYNKIEVEGLASYPLSSNYLNLADSADLVKHAVDYGVLACGGWEFICYRNKS